MYTDLATDPISTLAYYDAFNHLTEVGTLTLTGSVCTVNNYTYT